MIDSTLTLLQYKSVVNCFTYLVITHTVNFKCKYLRFLSLYNYIINLFSINTTRMYIYFFFTVFIGCVQFYLKKQKGYKLILRREHKIISYLAHSLICYQLE